MKDVDGLVRKGVDFLQRRRLGDAERCLRKATENAPGHFGALNLLAVALSGLERFREAEAVCERALSIDASSDATHYNYGSILHRNDKLEQAIAAFNAAVAINPRHVKALNNRGVVYSQLKRYEAAVDSFDRAIALEPRYVDAYFNKANALAAMKRRGEAQRDFERALSLNPEHAGAYANLLILLRELGQLDRAVECGRRAAALAPNAIDVRLNLAAVELDRGRLGAALRWLDGLASPARDALPALSARVKILVVLDRLEEADVCVDRLAALMPQDSSESAKRDDAIAALLFA